MLQYEGSWNQWQDLMEPITATAAYMSLPGNHEVTCTEVTPFLCPSYQRNLTAYRHRFRMPNHESGGTENLWYSQSAAVEGGACTGRAKYSVCAARHRG